MTTKRTKTLTYAQTITANGITRASTPQAIEAVTATRGEVLMYAGTICDARFSKCCGGAFEEFQNCWENVKHPYLIGQRDCKIEDQLPDLTIETEADKWIRTSPVAFCHTQDKKILSQVPTIFNRTRRRVLFRSRKSVV